MNNKVEIVLNHQKQSKINKSYFISLLNTIAIKIKEAIPEFQNISIFGNDFNHISDIELAPSLRVILSGINYSLNTNSNQLEVIMELSLVFITKEDSINNPHEVALDFLEKILLLVKNGN